MALGRLMRLAALTPRQGATASLLNRSFSAGCLNPQKNGFDFFGEWALNRGEMTI
jgi:hypothetical protein